MPSSGDRIRETVLLSDGAAIERDTPFFARSMDEYLFWCVRSNGRRSFYRGPDDYFGMPGVSMRIDGGNVTEQSVRAWIYRRDARACALGLAMATTRPDSVELAQNTLEYLSTRSVAAV